MRRCPAGQTHLRALLGALAMLFCAAFTAPAQISDSGATVTRLAEGVYAIIHAPAVHDWPSGAVDWPNGNTGVIIGDNGVLVIDSDFFPSRARADIALIRKLTTKPIQYLVNTHWHGDHTHGNGAYRDLVPNLKIVGARENAAFISLNQDRFRSNTLAASSGVRRRLASLEALLASGKDSSGKALEPAQIDRARSAAGELRQELTEIASVTVAPPTVLFERDTTIDLGRRKVVLRNWGRANSPADVTIYLPQERVLFTGDIVVHPIPYVFGAYPVPAIAVLAQLEQLPVTALVPGHGPVMKDHSYTRLVRGLFEAVRDRTEPLVRAGKTDMEVIRQVDLSDWRPKFVTSEDPDHVEYWNNSIAINLLRQTFICLTGSRC